MPHFFIIGAQKSGTTSLAAALARHPEVCFSRPKEPMYFSCDDPSIHPHFFMEKRTEWQGLVWNQGGNVLQQYRSRYFAHHQGEAWLGEASTSYLPSQVAPARLAEYCPDAKIIVLLRDPVQRAYSAYWHYVRSGRSVEGFAAHLQYENGLTLQMGEYVRHIRHWLGHFPKSQLLVIPFERMVAEPEPVLQQVCGFLGILYEVGLITLAKENAAAYPRSLGLKLWCNRMRRKPRMNVVLDGLLGFLERRNVQPHNTFPMDKALEGHLAGYYGKANVGLHEFLTTD